MKIPFAKPLIRKISSYFGLHPNAGDLISGSMLLTNPKGAPFPSENFPFASRVIASGIWNYCFFQFYRHFAGPYWVERQYNPEDPSFIPTAGSMMSVNLTHRNWMGFRCVHSDNHSIVDPSGALCPVSGYYSIETAVKEKGKVYLPSRSEIKTRQFLFENLPIPVTEYSSRDWTLHWISAGSVDDHILSRIDYEIKNGNEIELIISLRPFNPEGPALIHSIQVSEDRIISLNGAEEIELLDKPEKIILSNLTSGDAYFSSNEAVDIFCSAGVSTAAVVYRISKTGSIQFRARTYEREKELLKKKNRISRYIDSVVSEDSGHLKIDIRLREKGISNAKLIRRKKKQIEKQRNKSIDPLFHQNAMSSDSAKSKHSEEISKAIEDWKSEIKRASVFQCAKKEWNDAAKIFTGFLLTLKSKDSIFPGAFTYRNFWFRDAAYMVYALIRWNLLEDAKNILLKYPSLQDKSGFFKSHDGEWDSNGQAIWTLSKYASYSGDMDFLNFAYPSMNKGIHWIAEKRKNGFNQKLLPAGFSAEHLGPGDYYYWDNLWSIAGLNETLSASKILNKNNDADFIQKELDEYKKDFLEIAKANLKNFGLLPAGPERPADAGMIGNLPVVYPLELFDLFTGDEIFSTVNGVYNNYFNKGIFFHPIIHSGYNIYLSLQTAHALFLLGDTKKARFILKKTLEKRTDLWTYPEAIHPLTGGGAMGDGFHGWVFSEMLQLLREFALSQDKDSLYIFRGLRKNELIGGPLHFGPFPFPGSAATVKGNLKKNGGSLNVFFTGDTSPFKKIHIRLPWKNLQEKNIRLNAGNFRIDGNYVLIENFTSSIELQIELTPKSS